MNIITRANDFPLTGAIDEYVKGELRSAFQRLEAEIVSIDVSMRDANGPKGGVDKQVLICVRLRNRHQVALDTTHENLYAAIKTGVKRARRKDEFDTLGLERQATTQDWADWDPSAPVDDDW